MSQHFSAHGSRNVSGHCVPPPLPCFRALRRYNEAIKYADGVPPSESSNGYVDGNDSSGESDQGNREKEIDPDEQISRGGEGEDGFLDLRVAILCNQTACHLKLRDGAAALEIADRASALIAPADSAMGVKAAYRRACALESIGEWDEARHAFKRVLEVDPKNSKCYQVMANAGASIIDFCVFV